MSPRALAEALQPPSWSLPLLRLAGGGHQACRMRWALLFLALLLLFDRPACATCICHSAYTPITVQ